MKAGASVLSVRRPVDPAAAEAFLAGKPYPAPGEAPVLASLVEAASVTSPSSVQVDEPLAPAVAPTTPAPVAATATTATGATAAPLPGRKVHERKDGRRVRRTTILMREELARRLDLFAAARGVDKTAVHEAALEAWLAAQGE